MSNDRVSPLDKSRCMNDAETGHHCHLETLEQRVLLSANVFINEFMANNDSVLTDYAGDTPDWVELYNSGDTQADLSGWFLTDEFDSDLGLPSLKWQFPVGTTLDPGQYLVIFASDKDELDTGDELHTSFKLSSTGEYLGLVQADGLTVVSEFTPTYPQQYSDVSYGYLPASNDLRYFQNATPGTANSASGVISYVEPIVFSHDAGFYDNAFSLTLSTSTSGSTIRYTLDGSMPTTSSPIYSSAIPITTTTAVRAVAYNAGWEPSYIDTKTYIFLDDVIQQDNDESARDFPDYWINSAGGQSQLVKPADYEMDPDVVNDPAYASTIKDDLLSIPSMSIVMDTYDLWDRYNGIYANPIMRGDAWERAGSVELIDPLGLEGFQANAGMEMHGEASRWVSLNSKHNFQVVFKEQYGPSKLDYDLYPNAEDTSNVDTHNTFILRSHWGNSWLRDPTPTDWTGDDPTQAQYLRDQFAHDTYEDLGQLGVDGRFVHLYLNGVYWGLYQMIERPDDNYQAEHRGGNPEDYDVLKGTLGTVNQNGELQTGTRQAYDNMYSFIGGTSPVTDTQYDNIKEYLDIPAFIDYLMTQFHVGQRDWPRKNWYAAAKRGETAGGPPEQKFIFFTWDEESAIETIDYDIVGRPESNDRYETGPTLIYQRLRTNEQFQMDFADRVHELYFNGGPLSPAADTERYMELADQIDRAIVGESARWGDYAPPYANDPLTRDDEWIAQQDWIVNDYFPARWLVVLDQLRNFNLYPDVVAPSFSQHGGSIATGGSVTITATEGDIYYTVDGSDPMDNGILIASGQSVTIDQTLPLFARVMHNGEWSAKNAATFVTSVKPQVVISEINYNPADGDKYEFIEVKNVGIEATNLIGMQFTDGVDFTFPNWVLQPGETAVVVKSALYFESMYESKDPVIGEFQNRTQLNDGGETIELRDAGGQVVQAFTYDDAWYPSTDHGGYTLVAADPYANPADWNQADDWKASTLEGGAPGGIFPRIPGDANRDGQVGLLDLDALGRHYGTVGGATWEMGDFNESGSITLLDLDILGANWGISAGMSLNSDAATGQSALWTLTDRPETAPTTSHTLNDLLDDEETVQLF